MADGVEVNLTGLDSLKTKLAAVSDVTRNKAGRAALRKAAAVVRDRAISNASRIDDPKTKEAIYKNIVVSWSNRAFKRTGNLTFRIGVMGGARQYAATKENVRKVRAGKAYKTSGDKGNPGGDTWYWRFQEFGTQHTPAVPFMRPAMNSADDGVINVFVTEFEAAIDRAVLRAAKKGEQA